MEEKERGEIGAVRVPSPAPTTTEEVASDFYGRRRPPMLWWGTTTEPPLLQFRPALLDIAGDLPLDGGVYIHSIS
ncbi:hypothetical protein CRG98_035399 [Punica granatum]|uniref:Uncharacterized protein n=1 Tax=Punica granatum TaxID=22663 RepID=A0A2I0ILH1_PUNGR|nr:hypothetical protein CRG98_035399 [Punica granatum]